MFQEVNGPTPADGPTESIGLAFDSRQWPNRTFSQIVAAQPETLRNPNFIGGISEYFLANASGSNSITFVSDGLVTLTKSGGANPRLQQSFSVVAGKTYAFTSRGVRTSGAGNVVGVIRSTSGGASIVVNNNNTSTEVTQYFTAPDTLNPSTLT